MANIIEKSKSGSVTWYINEETRTVVAKIQCNSFEVLDLVDKVIYQLTESQYSCTPNSPNEVPFYISARGGKRFRIKDYYIGKAQCSPSDKFDVEFGKKLALLRAKQKYHFAVQKILIDYDMFLGNLFEAVACRAEVEIEKVDNVNSAIADALYEIESL